MEFLEHGLKKAAEKVFGRLNMGKKRGGGTKRLQKLLRGKKGYKKWRKDRSEENLEAYKVLKKEARREVASAIKSRQIEMANELEKGGSTLAFHIAKSKGKKRYYRRAMHQR